MPGGAWRGRTVPWLVLLTASASVASCGPADVNGELTVTSTDWNGWDENAKPTPRSERLPLREGESVELPALGDPVTFTVAEVDGDEITIESSADLAQREGNGIDLNDTSDSFTFSADEELELATATMDAGTNFDFAVE